MSTDLELLENFIKCTGHAKEAAKKLGLSAPVLSQYRNSRIPFSASLREKLRTHGFSDDSGLVGQVAHYQSLYASSRQQLLSLLAEQRQQKAILLKVVEKCDKMIGELEKALEQ